MNLAIKNLCYNFIVKKCVKDAFSNENILYLRYGFVATLIEKY